MAHNVKGSNYHPARVSGIVKKAMERESNKASKKQRSVKAIDISKPDWTIKKEV